MRDHFVLLRQPAADQVKLTEDHEKQAEDYRNRTEEYPASSFKCVK